MPEKEAFACIEFAGAGYTTRAYDPDEQLVKDISLLIFDEEGNLEHSSYLTDIDMNDSGHKLIVPLLMNRKYSFYACANFGEHAIIGVNAVIIADNAVAVLNDTVIILGYDSGVHIGGGLNLLSIVHSAAARKAGEHQTKD